VIVRVGMAPRATGLSCEECQRHWRTAHADAARQLPNLRGYVQDHAVLRDGRPLLPHPGFDVCAETEFDDLAAMDDAFASEQYQGAVRADERALIDKAHFAFALTERRVLGGGEPPAGAVKLMTFVRARAGAAPDALLDALAGAYADAVSAAAPFRHEQLVARGDWHEGREPAAFDAVDSLWFGSAEGALRYLASPAAAGADDALAGLAFGRERLAAAALRVV
jgi:uncharacterized protein (TIGR02118 family)